MRTWSFIAALTALMMGPLSAAHACTGERLLQIADAERADVVVVGRVVGYHIINSPSYSAATRRVFGREISLYRDAQFDIIVDQVLRGKVPARFSAMLRSTGMGGVPTTMKPGPYLIALNLVSATDKSPKGLAVQNHACGPSFMIEPNGETVASVRRALSKPRR